MSIDILLFLLEILDAHWYVYIAPSKSEQKKQQKN